MQADKRLQTYLALKNQLPPEPGCTTLGIKNYNQAFAITGEESFTSLWRNFAPPFFAELLSFTLIGEFSSINSLFKVIL